MSAASKLFYKAIDGLTCADLMHGNSSNCLESIKWNLTQTITGCCKYVLPIAIVIDFIFFLLFIPKHKTLF